MIRKKLVLRYLDMGFGPENVGMKRKARVLIDGGGERLLEGGSLAGFQGAAGVQVNKTANFGIS
jgi:hypothetical protein